MIVKLKNATTLGKKETYNRLFSSHKRWVFPYLPLHKNPFTNKILPPSWWLFVLYSMDSYIIERMKHINLTTEEGEVIKVRPSQREHILEEYSLSLLGKFHTTWPYNKWAAKTFLRLGWKLGQDLKIVEVGDGLFQFKFTIESQLLWVVNNGPWSFW